VAIRKIRVGLVATAVVNLPLWVAEDAGEFGRRGLLLDSTIIGSTQGTTDALLNGDIDVAFGSPDAAFSDPERVEIMAGLVDRPPLSLVAQPALITFESLRGKRFGTTSMREGTVQLIQAMLVRQGLSYPADYTFVMAGAHPQRWQALKEGSIDAAMQLMPFDFLAEAAGYAVLGRAEDVTPKFAFSSALVLAGLDVELKDEMREALLVGEEIARSDGLRAIEAITKRIPVDDQMARRCVARLIDDGAMPVGLVHSEEALERTRHAISDLVASAGPLAATDAR
jgi:ABC-type nitrate/sulfonate/bicarbonate transport system substrate-binding protein